MGVISNRDPRFAQDLRLDLELLKREFGNKSHLSEWLKEIELPVMAITKSSHNEANPYDCICLYELVLRANENIKVTK
jgi:hypothetical protein